MTRDRLGDAIRQCVAVGASMSVYVLVEDRAKFTAMAALCSALIETTLVSGAAVDSFAAEIEGVRIRFQHTRLARA